jgi:hypothetical protein
MPLVFGPEIKYNKKTADTLSVNNILLTNDNFELAFDNTVICYSDFGDLPIDKFELLALNGVKIIWEPGFGQQQDVYQYLNILKKYQKIDIDPMGIKQPTIATDSNHILFYGCSHTGGGPWLDKQFAYTAIVSKYFNKDALIPSKSETLKKYVDVIGNFNNFNLLANTNFLKDQIVILQLSDLSRVRFYDTTKQTICTRKLFDLSPHEVLLFDDQRLFHDVYERITQFINYAREKKLKFVFFNLGGSGISADKNPARNLTEFYLSDFKEFIPDMSSLVVDHGIDGTHFGVQSNKNFAKAIIQKIEELY